VLLELGRTTVKKQILIVDDDHRVLDALRRALREHSEEWAMTFISHPETAWEHLLETAYDAVVTDVKMPDISGLDLLERIRHDKNTKDVPVVVLTGLNDRCLKEKALNLGADDLLNKPVDTGQLIARLRSILNRKSYEDDLRARNDLLADKVRRQDINLAQSRMTVICRLGMAAEFRDEETGNHIIRVGSFSRAVAAALNMPGSLLETLLLAAPLHDIGKIGIPDSVLLKPGPLDDEEWTIMQRHCEMGHSILTEQSKAVVPLLDWYAVEPRSMKDAVENGDPVLEMAASIALTHHEKWDGSGYPQGLAGEAIPLESRIVAIADVLDALTSSRPYRSARSEDEALAIIESTAGSHFDPRVYAAFQRALPDIRAIRARFNDDAIACSQPEGALV
jgi:putative two-component system response regulator